MAKRFRSLKRALKTLMPVNAADGAAAIAPPPGSVLEYFATRGSRNIEYPSDANRSRDLMDVQLIPFGVAWVATALYRVPMSDQAFAAIGTYVGAEADLNINNTIAPGASINKLFKPAKVTVFIPLPDGEQPTGKTLSKITGFKYKKRAGNSKTYPFGQPTANAISYKTAKSSIVDKIATTTTNKASVSFIPEDARYL